MEYEIQMEGHGKLQQAFDRIPEIAGDEMHTAVTAGTHHMRTAVARNTPRGATKLLYRSIQAEITGSSMNVVGRVFSSDVPVKVASVEEGRSPGRMPPWGPGSSLRLWVTRIVGGDASVAFLIARAIGRRGTDGAFMFKNSYEQERGRVEAMFARVVDGIIRRAGL